MANIERTAFDEAREAIKRKSKARRNATGHGLNVEEAMREFFKAGIAEGLILAVPQAEREVQVTIAQEIQTHQIQAIAAALNSGAVKVSPTPTPFNSSRDEAGMRLLCMTPDDCRLGGSYGA